MLLYTQSTTRRVLFLSQTDAFPLPLKYAKKYKKLQAELDTIDDPQALVLVRLFLDGTIVKFKPKVEMLLFLLKSSVKSIRQEALYLFDSHYATQTLESLESLSFWLSGSVEGYKLADIRAILTPQKSKLLTRESKKIDIVVVGERCKLSTLPAHVPVISSLLFLQLLDNSVPVEREEESLSDDEICIDESANQIELLLSKDEDEVKEALSQIEEERLPLELLPLILGIFKVHPNKNIRQQAKTIIERDSSSMVKRLFSFVENRHYINAKYSVGMEELEKIKGFEIELFLYYLVSVQKNHLGKEYLARLDSNWTQRFIEEESLLNQKKVELFGEAGERFIFAKNIEAFTVHSTSEVLWQMSWLKSLEIIEKKRPIVLLKESKLEALELLTLEAKEVTLAGLLPIRELTLKKCKKLTIDKSLTLSSLELLVLEAFSFDLTLLNSLFKLLELSQFKKVVLKDFASHRVPKNWVEEMEREFLGLKIEIDN